MLETHQGQATDSCGLRRVRYKGLCAALYAGRRPARCAALLLLLRVRGAMLLAVRPFLLLLPPLVSSKMHLRTRPYM
jgi:hypothetical protein